MGHLASIAGLLIGDGRNVIKETTELFRENAEAASLRESVMRAAALEQFAAEFAQPRQGFFDRFVDGLNRIPRPLMAFGSIGLCIAAMVDPIWFAARMQGMALVPEPLWWLMGAIVSFYFGARYQVKGQNFQKSIAATLAQAPIIVDNLRELESLQTKDADKYSVWGAMREQIPFVGQSLSEASNEEVIAATQGNAALQAWRADNDE